MTIRRPAATSTPTTVGSGSTWVHAQLARPASPAPVLHAGRDAVHLRLGSSCLGVTSRRAAPLPCAVQTVLGSLPPVAAGAVVRVGDGAVQLASYRIEVVAVVDVRVPQLATDQVSARRDELALLLETVGAPTREIPPSALDALAAGDARAVEALLGRGPGLTPLGDDVLVGWLAAAVALRHPSLRELRGAIAAQAARRTTLLSTTLLACAARGEVVPELRSLLRTVGREADDLAAIRRATTGLVGVGGSSGAGMALGCLTALTTTHSTARVDA